MSFYRNLLIGFTAAAFALPVLAEDTTTNVSPTTQTQPQSQQSSTGIELTENGVKTEATPAVAEEAKPVASADTSAASSETHVNLNKARVKDLVKVKGLNAAKAKAIVTYRKKHGDFKSVDDLNQVKGFKKMKADELKKITDQLAV